MKNVKERDLSHERKIQIGLLAMVSTGGLHKFKTFRISIKRNLLVSVCQHAAANR